MRPIRPMVTAAFSLRLRGLRELHRMGTSRSMTGATKGSNCVAVTKARQGESISGMETANFFRSHRLEQIAKRSLQPPR